MLKVDFKRLEGFVGEHEIEYMDHLVKASHDMLYKKEGPGNDFLGWMDLPENYDKEEYDRVLKASEKIKNDSDVFIVIGIGGSYIGSKAAIEMLTHTFYNELPKEKRKTPEVYFLGQNISGDYLNHLLEEIGRASCRERV